MWDRITEAIGKALAYAVLAALAWYAVSPFLEAPQEFQRGLFSGLVMAYIVFLIFRSH